VTGLPESAPRPPRAPTPRMPSRQAASPNTTSVDIPTSLVDAVAAVEPVFGMITWLSATKVDGKVMVCAGNRIVTLVGDAAPGAPDLLALFRFTFHRPRFRLNEQNTLTLGNTVALEGPGGLSIAPTSSVPGWIPTLTQLYSLSWHPLTLQTLAELAALTELAGSRVVGAAIPTLRATRKTVHLHFGASRSRKKKSVFRWEMEAQGAHGLQADLPDLSLFDPRAYPTAKLINYLVDATGTFLAAYPDTGVAVLTRIKTHKTPTAQGGLSFADALLQLG
jgi:hypothetical protein